MSDEATPVDKASAKEESPAKEKASCDSAHATDKLALVFGSILCRLWLGVRALQTGIEKYAGEEVTGNTTAQIDGKENEYGLTAGSTVEKVYSLEAYHGVPVGLRGQLEEQPLMIGFFLNLFDKLLGPALILMGITVLLGVGTRISLMAQGLLYVGLTWGLILIKQDSGIAWLATHVILIVLALNLIKHDRFVILKKW